MSEEIAGGIPVVQAYSYVAFAQETQLCAGKITMHHRSGHLSVERNQRGKAQLSRDNPAPEVASFRKRCLRMSALGSMVPTVVSQLA